MKPQFAYPRIFSQAHIEDIHYSRQPSKTLPYIPRSSAPQPPETIHGVAAPFSNPNTRNRQQPTTHATPKHPSAHQKIAALQLPTVHLHPRSVLQRPLHTPSPHRPTQPRRPSRSPLLARTQTTAKANQSLAPNILTEDVRSVLGSPRPSPPDPQPETETRHVSIAAPRQESAHARNDLLSTAYSYDNTNPLT